MNTLKFTKKSELSTEQHNQEVHKEKEIKIFDKKVNIYNSDKDKEILLFSLSNLITLT